MGIPQSMFAAAVKSVGAHYQTELEINDLPQEARWKVTHKDSLSLITDRTGAAITTRGTYYAPGKRVPRATSMHNRKLFLLVEGPSERSVKLAKAEVKKILAAAIEKAQLKAGGGGRYQI